MVDVDSMGSTTSSSSSTLASLPAQPPLDDESDGDVPTLAAGIPPVHCRGDSGNVPDESLRSPCQAIEGHFSLYSVPERVAEFDNEVWRYVRNVRGVIGLSCHSERDVIYRVCGYLACVIRAMRLLSGFMFSAQLDIQSVAPHIQYLTIWNHRVVGVVVIKEKRRDILHEPTVLGELLDQLHLIEGFYRSGPIVGIITTLEQWRFCWLPESAEAFTRPDFPRTGKESLDQQPLFRLVGQNASPLGIDAPSLHRAWPRSISQIPAEEPAGDLRGIPGSDEGPRRLMVSPIVNGCTQGHLLLSYVYTAVARMTNVRAHQCESRVPRMVFKLTKDAQKITWHALNASHDLFIHRVLGSSQYPRADVTELIAIEDLGRGGSGKVWLTASLSHHPGLCVLKFSSDANEYHLNDEYDYWVLLYPHLAPLVAVETWSGELALRMPFLSSIAPLDRPSYREKVMQLLQRCEKVGHVHLDVYWRNIGVYLPSQGNEAELVLFDFSLMAKFDRKVHQGWKEAALKTLYLTEE